MLQDRNLHSENVTSHEPGSFMNAKHLIKLTKCITEGKATALNCRTN